MGFRINPQYNISAEERESRPRSSRGEVVVVGCHEGRHGDDPDDLMAALMMHVPDEPVRELGHVGVSW